MRNKDPNRPEPSLLGARASSGFGDRIGLAKHLHPSGSCGTRDGRIDHFMIDHYF